MPTWITSFTTAIALGLLVAPAADAGQLDFEVTLPNIGPDGTALDGRRIYLLPFETTTESPPEPAICVTTDAGETACDPAIGSDGVPCPDSYKCVLSVVLERPYKAYTVSVFDIDGLPGDMVEKAEGVIGSVRDLAEDQLGYDPGFADIAERARAANITWTWIESVSFQPLDEGTLYPKGDPLAERLARDIASALAPWHLFRFESGRIQAPFEVRAFEECAAPLPPCSFNYVQIAIREDGGS